jgi:hypothetical protein
LRLVTHISGPYAPWRVPDDVLPPDLASAGALSRHLLASPAKAHEMLGWHDTADFEVLRRSVAWHLKHPPSQADSDFAADDAALAARWRLPYQGCSPIGFTCINPGLNACRAVRE